MSALVTVVLAGVVGLATMGGIVARATPAAAARLSYGVVRDHVDIVDNTRSTPPRGSHGTLPYRELPTDLYVPDGPGPFPLVVFAAGFAIRTDAYAPMLDQWAAAGYVVAAPQFPISGLPSDGAPRRDDLIDEPGDISAVISFFQSATGYPPSPFFGLVDGSRIGVAGHSDGGTDAAAIAFTSGLQDLRVGAVLALSPDPPSFPGTSNGPTNRAPVLVMSGTADTIAPLANADAVYETAAAPRVQVRLEGGAHLEPFVSDQRFTGVAWAAQVDFLDATLRHDPTGRVRLAVDGSTAGVATMRQDGLQPNPFGSLDAVSVDALGDVSATGWAIDPDTGAAITVHLYVNGSFAGEQVAGQPRPDVGAAYPDLGAAHGFTATWARQATGTYEVCAYGINVGLGDSNEPLGCRRVTVATNPFGSLDRVVVDPLTRATAYGWAIDPDTAASLTVHTYVDGAQVATSIAAATRPDVGAAFPGFGSAHGFAVPLPPLSHGVHAVCVYGINVGGGTGNALLGGCALAMVDHDGFGNLDIVSVGVGGALDAHGWALDPDTTGPVTVHAYVDWVKVGQTTTGEARPDVDAAFPGSGTHHGFALPLGAAAEGPHVVCAYVINVGDGATNRLLGRCVSVMVTHLPFGSFDATSVADDGSIVVHGWAIDPDALGAIDVHVYVDGVMAASGTASGARPDVGQAFPLFGSAHGYDLAVAHLAPGAHVACTYGINVAAGHNEVLGCRPFTVA